MSRRPIFQPLALGLLFTWPAGSPADEPKPISPTGPGYRLAWHDEFDGDQLDTGKWIYRNDTRFWSMPLGPVPLPARSRLAHVVLDDATRLAEDG